MAGTIGSLGNVRGWICLGSGHPFAKVNSRRRGTGKVQISTRQAARLLFPPVSLPPGSQRIIIHGASNDTQQNDTLLAYPKHGCRRMPAPCEALVPSVLMLPAVCCSCVVYIYSMST